MSTKLATPNGDAIVRPRPAPASGIEAGAAPAAASGDEALSAVRLQFVGVDAIDPEPKGFWFDDPDDLGEAIDIEFGAGDPLIPAASFHSALRSPRHMIDRKNRPALRTFGRSNSARHERAQKVDADAFSAPKP